MFSALRHRTAALGVCFILPAHARPSQPGEFANEQARHIATLFPVPNDRYTRGNALCRLFAAAVRADGL